MNENKWLSVVFARRAPNTITLYILCAPVYTQLLLLYSDSQLHCGAVAAASSSVGGDYIVGALGWGFVSQRNIIQSLPHCVQCIHEYILLRIKKIF